MFQTLFDFFFPRRSLSGEVGKWITQEERRQLASFPVIENKEQLRRRGLEHIDRITAGSAYQNCPLLKKAIHTFKYRGVRELAENLAELMLRATPEIDGAVLCPVPLHWSRRFSRGFNQSQILANIVGAKLGVRVEQLVKRTRPTGHQVGRPRTERLKAVSDAFTASDNPPPHVTLIDDLATTGATLDACAKALKIAGVKRVEGWVVAHG